jgi:hypothetical protein
MRLYAQHGAQAGDKIAEGFRRGLLDGVIYSPRDISRTSLKEQLVSISGRYPAADLLLDSQLIVSK